MIAYLIRRMFAAVLTIFVATVAVSMLIHVVPGDPVEIMYAQSQGTTPEQLAQIRDNLGLDEPVYVQYAIFMNGVLHGDLGETIRGEQPVFDLIMGHLPNTLILAGTALAIAIIVGMTLGFIAAYQRGGWLDTSLMTTAMIGISIPHFWLGLLLIMLFAVNLGWLPVAGTGPANLILPALTLAAGNAAIIARMTRSSMIDVFDEDFIRTAHAKGLRRRVVLSRHVLRAGLVPIVSMIGMQFTYMMGGAIVVENVFGWNGIGRLALQAILQRDYPLIQGFILAFACVVVTISLLMDVLYAFLDPRIRYT